MKYYLRSIRKDGFGECVVPEMEEPIFKRDAAIATQQNLEWHSYLSSLPVSALAHPEVAKKIGWVENAEERYEIMWAPQSYEWKPATNEHYDLCSNLANRRILLVEKKQEEKSEVDELAPEEKELLHWWRDARKCVKSGKFSIADERLQKCKDILGDANDYV